MDLHQLWRFVGALEVLLVAGVRSSLYGVDHMNAAVEAEELGWVKLVKGWLWELEKSHQGTAGFVAKEQDPHAKAVAVRLTDKGREVLQELERFKVSLILPG